MSTTLQAKAVRYPESDGKPMGETDRHRNAMVRHIEILSRYFAGQQVYVSGDLLLYYEEGNPQKFIVPDAFVAKGVAPGERRIYKLWEEQKAPDVVIETTSRKTRKKDATVKPSLYAQLGVREYFIFDPERDYLAPPLQGYRLAGANYERIVPDAEGRLLSAELGMLLSLSDRDIEFDVVSTGERLLTGGEVALRELEARRAAEAAFQSEVERRRAAEAEVVRLRAELARRPSTTDET
ncbi:MAG: Uma2 family endonuclease [Candidatus Saccharimonas sp.]|nr:Uma2 family endonuclease [Planctomycetaceae bacterium]